MQVKFKNMDGYGATDGEDIYINKKKNKNGVQYLDTYLHEVNHIHNPKMSERAIIKKTSKDRESYLAII